MRPIFHLRRRSLSSILALTLVSVPAAPVAALSTAALSCLPTVATTAGLRDMSGRLREPLVTNRVKEVPAKAQHRGGPGFKATINVYFHVITDGAEGAVSSTTISQQMSAQNVAYSGAAGGAATGFTFKLAGVDTANNAAWFDAGPGTAAEAEMKQALKRGGPEDMNVYTNSGAGLLGWAYYPSIVGDPQEYLDGVVMDYRSLPGGPYGTDYSLGGTLPHEAGHWLGLLHTFEGGTCSPNDEGDLVADTPQERTPTGGCPEGKDSCKSLPGLDPIHNYMDYSFDSCYTQFTPGQASRMQDQYLFFRD